MDCAAEERLVRMAVAHNPAVHWLQAALSYLRTVQVYHDGLPAAVLRLPGFSLTGQGGWLAGRHCLTSEKVGLHVQRLSPPPSTQGNLADSLAGPRIDRVQRPGHLSGRTTCVLHGPV